MPSLRNNLAARLVADTYGLATALISATITARVLGPSGRGYYASLVLLTVLFVQLFNAGLGEAVVVMAGKGRASLQTAVSATVAALLPVAAAGTLLFLLTGWLVLDVETSNDVLALMVSGASVLLNVFSSTLVWLLVSRERIVLHALILIVSATTATAAIYVLVVLVDWARSAQCWRPYSAPD